ncbi:transmembrane protein 72-like [Haliotis asinina]|uniref:transmembrane protein 72-like n=1 Tax=Haliotis asinina TaxID=109174 RepID=UPI003531A2F4
MGLTGRKCDCCCEVFLWFCRVVGIATALVLWGAGVEAAFYQHVLGIYMLVAAVVVTALEFVFVINYFVEICTSSTAAKCWRFWDCVMWLDDWKKGVLYIAICIPCFIQPHKVVLGVLAGSIMFVSAMLYMLKTFKTRRERRLETITQKPSYDRFEDIHEDLHDDLEDSIVNPNSDLNPIPSVADQSEILEM